MSKDYQLKPQETFVGNVQIKFHKVCSCCGKEFEVIPSYAVMNSFAIWWNCECHSTIGVTWKYIPEQIIQMLDLPFLSIQADGSEKKSA